MRVKDKGPLNHFLQVSLCCRDESRYAFIILYLIVSSPQMRSKATFQKQLSPKISHKLTGGGHNTVWKAIAPWWSYLEQHICILSTGSQCTDRTPVGVSLNGWRLLHNTLRLNTHSYFRHLEYESSCKDSSSFK